MIEIELVGSATAIAAGITSTTNTAKGPIGPLCRKLIANGHSLDTIASVRRSGTLVFKPAPLSAWAKYDTVDHEAEGLKRRVWKPFNEDARASLAHSRGGVAETV